MQSFLPRNLPTNVTLLQPYTVFDYNQWIDATGRTIRVNFMTKISTKAITILGSFLTTYLILLSAIYTPYGIL